MDGIKLSSLRAKLYEIKKSRKSKGKLGFVQKIKYFYLLNKYSYFKFGLTKFSDAQLVDLIELLNARAITYKMAIAEIEMKKSKIDADLTEAVSQIGSVSPDEFAANGTKQLFEAASSAADAKESLDKKVAYNEQALSSIENIKEQINDEIESREIEKQKEATRVDELFNSILHSKEDKQVDEALQMAQGEPEAEPTVDAAEPVDQAVPEAAPAEPVAAEPADVEPVVQTEPEAASVEPVAQAEPAVTVPDADDPLASVYEPFPTLNPLHVVPVAPVVEPVGFNDENKEEPKVVEGINYPSFSEMSDEDINNLGAKITASVEPQAAPEAEDEYTRIKNNFNALMNRNADAFFNAFKDMFNNYVSEISKATSETIIRIQEEDEKAFNQAITTLTNEKDAVIAGKDAEIASRDADIASRNQEITNLTNTNNGLQNDLQNANNEIARLREELAASKAESAKKDEEIAELNVVIENDKTDKANLEEAARKKREAVMAILQSSGVMTQSTPDEGAKTM